MYNTMVYTTAVGGSPGGVSCDARSHTMAAGESVLGRILWCNCTVEGMGSGYGMGMARGCIYTMEVH